MLTQHAVLVTALNVAVAAIGALPVGLEREIRRQPLGVRTSMVIAVGAALYTMVGGAFGPASDPSRVSAQIVTGVGFLGGGAIVRYGLTVRGLTTAATIWVDAAIGMAAGAGFYAGVLVASPVIALILAARPFLRAMSQGVAPRVVVHGSDPNVPKAIVDVLAELGMSEVNLGIDAPPSDSPGPFHVIVTLWRISLPRGYDMARFIARLGEIEGVRTVKPEGLRNVRGPLGHGTGRHHGNGRRGARTSNGNRGGPGSHRINLRRTQ